MRISQNAKFAFFSKFKTLGITLVMASALAACGGSGGGGGSTGSSSTSVKLNGQVYDQIVANATVTVYLGTTAVATTTTDQNGNYSVNLSVSKAARSSRMVLVAAKDKIKLRSLLGNAGNVADVASGNSGQVSGAQLASANVTNVSTAITAMVENSLGALPDTQTEIDAAITGLAGNTDVIKIAAAIKAVVDYSGDPTSFGAATNTDELALALAASGTLATDVDTVVATSSATSTASLETEVTSDPTLAEQIPTNEATLVTGLSGKSYVVSNSVGEETLLVFDPAPSTAVTVASYADIANGGLVGQWVDNQDGTFDVDFTDPIDGALHVVATVTGGSTSAFTGNVMVTNANAVTSNEGPHTFRQLIPVVNATSSASQINIADIAGTTFFNMEDSTAVSLNACDGNATNLTFLSAAGSTTGTCTLALGMAIFTDAVTNVPTVRGFLADAWDGAALSQRLSNVSWIPDNTYGSVAVYGHLYLPKDSAAPTFTKVLRILPDSGDGTVGAQIRIVAVADTAGDTAADGKVDLYNYLSQVTSAKTKDHITVTTHPDTGTLLVNGSVNEGQVGGTTGMTWATSTHASVAIGINLGSSPSAKLRAIYTPNKASPTVRTEYVYGLSDITALDLSGKTFAFTSLIYPDSGTVTFNANGTATVSQGGGTNTLAWTIEVPVAASQTTHGVAYTGTSLVLTDANTGDKEYLFGSAQGTNWIIGGYSLDAQGSFADVTAVMLTPM